MGMDVKLTLDTAATVRLDAARRRGMRTAGEAVLALSDARAPIEPVARHGVHGVETGFVRPEVTGGGDRVAVGYGAYWMVWQHERLDYHHTHGQAKFLELALVEGSGTAWEIVAAALREAL